MRRDYAKDIFAVSEKYSNQNVILGGWIRNIRSGKEVADCGDITFRSDLRVSILEQMPDFKPGTRVLDCPKPDECPFWGVRRDF